MKSIMTPFSLPTGMFLLAKVILTFCNEAPRYWGCVNGNCYYSSYTFMTQFQASQFCFRHNMTSGLASGDDYIQLRGVPSAGNYTWTGIQRYFQDLWKFLSEKEPPAASVAAESSSHNCGYQKRMQFFGEECYVKKKYVCQGTTGENDYSIHHTPLSWYKARNDCLRQGSDLYDPFHQGNPGYKLFEDSDEHFWIGLTKEIWSWTATGKEVTTSHWTDSQPYGNGTCVSFRSNGWYLSDCSKDLAQALCVRTPSTESECGAGPTTTTTENLLEERKPNEVPNAAGPAEAQANQDDENDRNKIVGGAVGGSLAVIAIIVIVNIIVRRKPSTMEAATQYDPDDFEKYAYCYIDTTAMDTRQNNLQTTLFSNPSESTPTPENNANRQYQGLLVNKAVVHG